MQEKDLEISYKILHFYPDLRGKFTLLLAKIVHFFPVKVDNFLRNLKVFFLRSGKMFTKFKCIFPAPRRKNTFKIPYVWEEEEEEKEEKEEEKIPHV